MDKDPTSGGICIPEPKQEPAQASPDPIMDNLCKFKNSPFSIFIRNLRFENCKIMIVQANQSPNFNDLIQTLRMQFPNYTVYKFASKPLKSIIVQKSVIIGAQITLRNNEIIVDACCPNIFLSGLLGALSAILTPYHIFEMKITDFLKSNYN